MKQKWFAGRENLFLFALLIIISALVYLPWITRIGYSHDDWYLMASARAEGAKVFHEIYSVDRPLRAYVFEPAYMLFGENIILYNLSAWGFRTLSAIVFLWLLQKLWPGNTSTSTGMALLYVLYPGFLSQPNGIDYLPQMVSLAAAMLSIALTVSVLFETRLFPKILGVVFAIALGVFYLGLVEYEVGLEFFRLAIIFVLLSRKAGDYKDRLLKTLRAWLPYSLILILFGIWRVFLFSGERKATDIGVQFEQIKLYPLQTVYAWGVQVFQDLFDVTLSAWVIPLSQLTNYIQRWGGVLAILITGSIFFVSHILQERNTDKDTSEINITREALLLGLFTAIAGLIPIAMVNRDVSFPSYSRYTLPGSVGVAILIVGLLMCLNGKFLRNVIFSALCLISALTQHANSMKFVTETNALRSFWWQVSWRIPQFEKNTTLIATYPNSGIEEDYFIWGPASLIYYPEKQNPKGIQPGLFASVLNKEAVHKVLIRERQKYDDRKNIITYANHRNMLVLTQPTTSSCVHIIDGIQPEYSTSESDTIRVIGPFSETEHILVDETPHAPPVIVFGSEPARGWCFSYQKADLARQKGDWDEVLDIGEQAFEKDLFPRDLIEWMPFLQAYAQAGDIDRLTELAPTINADPYIALQACHILGSMPGISAEVLEIVDSLYCPE